jgi:UDP-4-amino-4,6-dideoxy-N-acetyl-beta-L-altrosamine transaminase
MKPIPYGHQYITAEDIQAVVEALNSDWITQGPKGEEFEKNFAAAVGAKYAVTCSNGTAALHISALALGVKPGDRVIVTPLTFVASANCVRYCGGDVEFCDIDPETFLIDYDKLKTKLESHPKGYYKGIVPVDFAGYPIDGEKFRKLADEYGLWIIEDACHAPGAYFVDSEGNKQMSGNGRFTECTVFSFHPVKHITCGEGGMVTTNDDAIYKKLCLFRSHGVTKDPELMTKNDGGWYYEMLDLGFNYRMTEMQAALGNSQLKRLDWSLHRRHEIAARYDAAFAGITEIKTPKTAEGFYHALHLYIIRVPDRKGLYDFLRANGVMVQIHYYPVNLQPYYLKLGNKRGDLPVVEDYYAHCISLPMFPTLTEEEQEYTIAKVKEYICK